MDVRHRPIKKRWLSNPSISRNELFDYFALARMPSSYKPQIDIWGASLLGYSSFWHAHYANATAKQGAQEGQGQSGSLHASELARCAWCGEDLSHMAQ